VCFESAWEAFTERAAIMEIDGGLDRRAVTLRAFGLCFPGDYRECTRNAGKNPDRKTAIEEPIKIWPQSHEKGPPLNPKLK
jgi:hypothetical protein